MQTTGIAALNKWFKKGDDSKARRAHWKQFDDTHHWDASADDWVRNDGQRLDQAAHREAAQSTGTAAIALVDATEHGRFQ
jgi:hypothetical protein